MKIVAGLVRIGKNRSVQEGLGMKIVAGLDKIGLFRKRWISKRLLGCWVV